jgi:RNA polymerase sigma-70 factor (ECF subfamily)
MTERACDTDLVRRFRGGDRDAFTAIYRTHHRAVFRFSLLMSGDEFKAAEVTQDVFVWLIHHAGSFDPDRGELGSFLVGIARKMLKHRHAEEQRWLPLDEGTEAEVPPAKGHDEDVAGLRRAILALPERYRAVVVLCDLEEKSYEEAAALIDCAVGTVRSRLHRARTLLARKLTGKGCLA